MPDCMPCAALKKRLFMWREFGCCLRRRAASTNCSLAFRVMSQATDMSTLSCYSLIKTRTLIIGNHLLRHFSDFSHFVLRFGYFCCRYLVELANCFPNSCRRGHHIRKARASSPAVHQLVQLCNLTKMRDQVKGTWGKGLPYLLRNGLRNKLQRKGPTAAGLCLKLHHFS